MLTDFMDNLSCGSWKREGRDKVKQFLIEYFIEHGYGKDFYTPEDLKMMFRELDAMGLLFPKDGEQELVDAYSAWRQIQQEFLFNKWYNRWFFPLSEYLQWGEIFSSGNII